MSKKISWSLFYVLVGGALSITTTSLSATGQFGNRYIKKCWYDGDHKSFRSELEELADTLENNEDNDENAHQEIKKFIEEKSKEKKKDENNNLDSYCQKRVDTLMQKLDEFFESIYNGNNDEAIEMSNKILEDLSERWNEYNLENPKDVWAMEDTKGVLSHWTKTHTSKIFPYLF